MSKLDIDRFFQKTDSEDKIVEHKFTKPLSGMFSQSVQVEAVTKPDGVSFCILLMKILMSNNVSVYGNS